jgi:transposase
MAKGKYKEWLKKENLIKIKGWAIDGLSNKQIAHNIGINEDTLYTWQKKYTEFAEALKKSKEVADREVENSLHKSANGYFVEESKKVIEEKDDGTINIKTETNKRWIPPNTAAQIFWLKNRKPTEWRDKPDDSNDTAQDSIKILAEVIRESRKNEA